MTDSAPKKSKKSLKKRVRKDRVVGKSGDKAKRRLLSAKTKASRKSKYPAGLPNKDQLMEFINQSHSKVGKREIAKAFGLKAQEKIALKALLRDMADEGLIDGEGRAFHKMGGVPKVTVLKITAIDGKTPIAVPEKWEAEGIPAPKIKVIEKGQKSRSSALGVGDRILARTQESGSGWQAFPMKKLAQSDSQMLGIISKDHKDRHWLKSVDKKIRYDTLVSDMGDAKVGDLVLADIAKHRTQSSAKVSEILGDPLSGRTVSQIAIHKFDIPNIFPQAVEQEASDVLKLPIIDDEREDLRHLPIVAIDPRDARDYDDALWAQADDDPSNAGGYKAIIAIADVSHYVRPGSALDTEAQKRGNSVYFPDLVVPMLPHTLSSDKCSLKSGEDRAALTCQIIIDKNGKVTSWRFKRATIRISANIAYEDAQGAIDGTLEKGHTAYDYLKPSLQPLWDCWALLAKARDKRQPLALDLPERRITIDENGSVTGVAVRERLDAHMLVEDFMIAANVAAAKALESKKSDLIYRVHEAPAREKLVALKDFLKSYDMPFAMGQVITPAIFNALLKKIDDEESKPQIMIQVLRSQTQAYYSPKNGSHFGLALTSYAHFTSPIRRYADLIVHRALVGSFGLEVAAPKLKNIPETSALTADIAAKLSDISEAISRTERRAMEAERETTDRYVAAYLSTKLGETINARITGVQNFGFFATVEDIGGDGLVPISSLRGDYYIHDEASQTLTGERNGQVYKPGMTLELVIAEANPASGALKFELPDSGGKAGNYVPNRPNIKRSGKRNGNYKIGTRGRPKNIKHKGKRK